MKYLIIIALFIGNTALAQVVNTGMLDTSGGAKINKFTIGGYIDTYYGIASSPLKDEPIPYFVCSNRSNELNVNLAYIDVRYNDENYRARLVPGFGTYINTNYERENGSMHNLVEASVGLRLSKKKDIWLDAGVLGSPYTNESAISKDHLMYTRSIAIEYVPYYLSGIRISIPLSEKVNLYLYGLNGWQQIHDNNKGKSIGTHVEYRPNNKNLINWDTYTGDERSDSSPMYRMRYFSDVYWIYNPDGKFSITSCAYLGNQQSKVSSAEIKNNYWWQVNINGRYTFNKKCSLSGRLEYFKDENQMLVRRITSGKGFNTAGYGLCFNVKAGNTALFRMEGRQLLSTKSIYLDPKSNPVKMMSWICSSITVWF